MAFNINEIRSQLALGGARPTLFQVNIQNPANAAGDLKTPFLVRASQVPASTLGFGFTFTVTNVVSAQVFTSLTRTK